MTRPVQRDVVILGGGCGGLAAAYCLSATEELRSRYRVTVYQHGWRLGGKGASGRRIRPDNSRIEEHGLHMWFGFYETAFRILRDCYRAWPHRSFEDAFSPQPRISFAERGRSGNKCSWTSWTSALPDNLPGKPGDGAPLSHTAILLSLLKWIIGHARTMDEEPSVRESVTSLRRAHAAAERIHSGRSKDHIELHSHLHEAQRRTAVARANQLGREHASRPNWVIFDLALAAAAGFVKDILPEGEEGYRRIDDLDFRDWLQAHGASKEALDSGVIRAVYSLGFAFLQGDPGRPSGAAGVSMRILLHAFFACKGATLWRMNDSMGDTVFAPMYEVLVERGVRFEFFHRVRALRLSKTRRLIEKIELERQVRSIGRYEPLICHCWPNEPLWNQIENGTGIAESLNTAGLTLESAACTEADSGVELELGKEFDYVVLATSLAPIPQMCDELVVASRAWREMVANIETVATQAFQLWVNREPTDLGWPDSVTVMTGFAEPMDTWAVMSHLIEREGWARSAGVRGIHYFCGPLSDQVAQRSGGREADEGVRRSAQRWMENELGVLWPKARTATGFDWNVLIDPANGHGVARLDAQYFRANVDPSERYVLSTPGSTRFRLHPGQSDFENLYLAGDWTLSRFNCGCVEAAMESGALAAQCLEYKDQGLAVAGDRGYARHASTPASMS